MELCTAYVCAISSVNSQRSALHGENKMHGKFEKSGFSSEYSAEMCDISGHQNLSLDIVRIPISSISRNFENATPALSPHLKLLLTFHRLKCTQRHPTHPPPQLEVVDSRCSTSTSKLPLLCEKIEGVGLGPVLQPRPFGQSSREASRPACKGPAGKYQPFCFVFRAKCTPV